MSITFKLFDRFNTFPIRIIRLKISFSVELDKPILKCIWKYKRSRITNTHLKISRLIIKQQYLKYLCGTDAETIDQ